MSIKKSVILTDFSHEFMKKRTRNLGNNDTDNADEPITWSRFINESINILEYLSKTELPELTSEECQIILNTYAGCFIELVPPFRIASDIMDDLGVVDLQNLAPEIANFVKKVHGFTQAQQFSILDFVRKFWVRDRSDCKDFSEIIQKIKK